MVDTCVGCICGAGVGCICGAGVRLRLIVFWFRFSGIETSRFGWYMCRLEEVVVKGGASLYVPLTYSQLVEVGLFWLGSVWVGR